MECRIEFSALLESDDRSLTIVPRVNGAPLIVADNPDHAAVIASREFGVPLAMITVPETTRLYAGRVGARAPLVGGCGASGDCSCGSCRRALWQLVHEHADLGLMVWE